MNNDGNLFHGWGKATQLTFKKKPSELTEEILTNRAKTAIFLDMESHVRISVILLRCCRITLIRNIHLLHLYDDPVHEIRIV